MSDKKEKAVFDYNTQMSFLKLAFNSDNFCSNMVRYIGAYNQKEKRYEKIAPVFDLDIFEIIMEKISIYYNEYNSRPSEKVVKQLVMDHEKNEEIFKILEKIEEIKITQDEENFYKKQIETFLKRAYLKKGISKVNNLYKDGVDTAVGTMGAFLEDINKISFAESNEVYLDVDYLINPTEDDEMIETIPTGIEALDVDTCGGLPRSTLIIVLAGTNVGKSMFCISLGCNALRAKNSDGSSCGYKVFHVALEGREKEAMERYLSNLAGVPAKDITRRDLSPEQKRKIKEASEKYMDRLVMYNMIDFNSTVENLAAICREKHKEFPFDVLIIDYGQLLESTKPFKEYRLLMADVYRKLTKLARELDVALVSPAQSTRNAQIQEPIPSRSKDGPVRLPVITSEDISEAFEIARVAGLILTLNMTHQEMMEGKMRVYLEKNRLGEKGRTYGLKTNYSECNLITGEVFDPNSQLEFGEGKYTAEQEDIDEFSIKEAVSLVYQKQHKENITKMDELYEKIDILNNKMIDKKAEAEQAQEQDPFSVDDDASLYNSCIKELNELKEEKGEYIKLFNNAFVKVYPKAKEKHLVEVSDLVRDMTEQGESEEKIKHHRILMNRMEVRFEQE